MNIFNRNNYINNLIKINSTKVLIFFATSVAGDDYDPYEKNYTMQNLNPLTIKGYVREISPEALVWKQYGLSEMGAKEILCDEKYKSWFEKCNKVTISGDSYEVFRESGGNRAIIQKRPFKTIRVVLQRKE